MGSILNTRNLKAVILTPRHVAVFLLTAAFALTALAQTGETAPEAEPAAQSPEQNKLTSEDENELTEAQLESDLRSRALGDAFKNFTPSEEISADNAVSFPVDI